jgi:hypothetical protein
LVSPTASSLLCTVSWSLLTAALAEARLASRVAALIAALLGEPELSLPVEEEPLERDSSCLLRGAVVLEVAVWVGSEEVVLVAGEVVAEGAVGLGESPCGEPLLGVVVGLVVVFDSVVVGEAPAGAVAVAAVAVSLVCSTEAVAAVALPPAPEPPEPVALSPSVSSSLARFASADKSVALDCSSVTSALCGLSSAINLPSVTYSPWDT